MQHWFLTQKTFSTNIHFNVAEASALYLQTMEIAYHPEQHDVKRNACGKTRNASSCTPEKAHPPITIFSGRFLNKYFGPLLVTNTFQPASNAFQLVT
jgi:hypothetical protein